MALESLGFWNTGSDNVGYDSIITVVVACKEVLPYSLD